VTNVLIVASNSLPASYFRKVRQELGGGPNLVIDALVWSPPQEPVDDMVRCFELIGPGEESGPDSTPSPSGAAATETSESADRPRRLAGPVDTGSTDARTEPPTKPPITGLARIRAGVKRRVLRRVRARLRRREAQAASRTFWKRVRSTAAAHQLVREADLVLVVDVGALRTGWHLARRYPDRSVVFGLPAAAVHLKGGIPG
jgi:hypothetical protein